MQLSHLYAGRQQIKSSWSAQLMLNEEPESADQIRKLYKIFFLSDTTALWALMSRVSERVIRKMTLGQFQMGRAPAEPIRVHHSTQGDEKFIQKHL